MTDAAVDCLLLVDDSEADNYFHRLVLEEVELVRSVHVARDGREALELIRPEASHESPREPLRPQLILLDLNMPRMNGWEFLDAYHEFCSSELPGTAVVVLTTSENPDDRERALKHPVVDGFLVKPLTRDELTSLVVRFD